LPRASVPEAPFAPGSFHENAAHRFGRGGEEMAAAVPTVDAFSIHQAQISFVDERGGIKCLPGFLRGHPGCRESAQLGIDERQQFGGGARVAGFDRLEDARHVGHGITAAMRRHERLQYTPTVVVAAISWKGRTPLTPGQGYFS
jgi:hypothetical protein